MFTKNELIEFVIALCVLLLLYFRFKEFIPFEKIF